MGAGRPSQKPKTKLKTKTKTKTKGKKLKGISTLEPQKAVAYLY
jgi:hypothetical protein